MFALSLTYYTFTLGLLILWLGQLSLLPFFLVAGYLAVFLILLWAVRFWRDLFNPLCLILVLGFVRFSLPAFLVLFRVDPQIALFEMMGLRSQDWQLAYVLALTGILGVVIGWFLIPGRVDRALQLKFRFAGGVSYAALAGMLVGFIALLLFIGSNAPVMDVAISGEFRGTTIQEGTGKYWYLGLMLISSSVLLSGYLLARSSRPKWTSFVPVILAMFLFWVLGGRARMLTPLISGLLLMWYLRREQMGWDRAFFKSGSAYALIGIIGTPFAIWIAYVGELYRGGSGIHAVLESLSLLKLWQYLQYAVFTDFSGLYALAGAVAIGPGLLWGQTFISSLLWPLSDILHLPGKSGGIFIVETLVGFGERRWGVHSSLIGDTYLNFGIAGIPIVMGVFGMLLKIIYVKFRRGSVHSGVYTLAVVYSLRIFFESINKWGEALVVLAFALFIILLGELLSLVVLFSKRGGQEAIT